MTTYVLDGKASASLPRRPLAVRMATAGGSVLSARLAARSADGQAPRVIQQSGGLLILPRVDGEVTIVAVPETGLSRFDPGTVLHVSFGPDNLDDLSADVAQLTPRDVSGMSFIELATVAPGGADSLVVRTRLAVPDAPLPPLAASARVACRAVLRADQIAETDTRSVRCVIDTSASMARLFADGVVAASGEVIAGIAAVIGEGAAVSCALAGGDVTDIEPAQLGDFLSRPPARGYGFVTPVIPAHPLPDASRSLTIVVTDGTTATAAATSPSASTATLVLSAARLAVTRAGFTGALFPPPPAGQDPRAALTADTDQLSAIVSGLLAPTGLVGARR
ncbi:hypothetical protein ACWDPV_13850 [Gordonia sp. NPDC003504]